MLQTYMSYITATFNALVNMILQTWQLYTTVPIFMGVIVILIARWVLRIFGILKG